MFEYSSSIRSVYFIICVDIAHSGKTGFFDNCICHPLMTSSSGIHIQFIKSGILIGISGKSCISINQNTIFMFFCKLCDIIIEIFRKRSFSRIHNTIISHLSFRRKCIIIMKIIQKIISILINNFCIGIICKFRIDLLNVFADGILILTDFACKSIGIGNQFIFICKAIVS